MRGAFVDPGGDLPQLKARGRAGRRHHREDPADPRPYRPLRQRPAIFAEELGVPIEGPHEADRFWIDKLGEDGPKYGIAGRPFEPSRWLDDGDTGHRRRAHLRCPPLPRPHARPCRLPSPESKLALVGDVLFKGSVGRWDFPRGDQQQLIRSSSPGCGRWATRPGFVPGHGPMSTFGHERATNPFVGDARRWRPKAPRSVHEAAASPAAAGRSARATPIRPARTGIFWPRRG